MCLYQLFQERPSSHIRDPEIWPLFDLKWPLAPLFTFNDLKFEFSCQYQLRNICISHVLELKLTIWPLDDLYMTFYDPRIHIFALSAKSAFIWYAYYMTRLGYNMFCCISCFATSWSLNTVISRIHSPQVFFSPKINSSGFIYPG